MQVDQGGRHALWHDNGVAESSLYSYAFGATVFSIRTTGKGERVLYGFSSYRYEGNSPTRT